MTPEALFRTYLAHILLNNEFQLAFGPEAMGQLSHLPAYPLLTTDKDEEKRIPGPKSLPPLSRLVFYLLTAKCPVFFIHGQDFVGRLDELIDAIFVSTVFKFSRATQFDLLACQDHVLTLLAHLNDEILSGSFRADKMYTVEQLWPWCQKVNYVRAFDIRGKIEAEDLKDAKLSESRQEKFLSVAHSMGRLFAAVETVRRSSYSDYWSVFKDSPSVEELPEEFSAVYHSVVDTAARVLDVILDHSDRRKNLQLILDKIPVSLIVFSLRFIDPAALVEQVIQLFTWKPPGLHSLLQKVGGLICSEGRTEEQIKAFKQKIGHKRAAMLESLVTYGRVINEITMSDTAQRLEAIQSFSSEDLDGDDLEFIQLLIRLEEKTAFIDILAHQDVTALIRHCGHVFPPFLRQISKYGNMATIMSNFFSALQDILKTLHVYDEPLPSDEDSIPDYWKETVPAIKDSLLPLFGDFYAVIHSASLDPEFGLIHDAVDWLFELVETISKGMPDTEVVFSHLSKSDIRGMMDAVENGLARVPREMPRDSSVFSKAAPIAHRLILQKLSLKL